MDSWSVPRVTRAWYVACESRELRSAPMSRTLLDTPVVLFRDGEGKASALLDRCAHRNVPLSLGRRVEGRLECAYHGWQYDGGGVCRKIPGLLRDADRVSRYVPSFPVRERDGFVWVWAEAGETPATEPYAVPARTEGYTEVRRVVEAEASLPAALENALDVPHTAFLHKGLFRGSGKTNRIRVKVRRIAGGIEAEYLGEPRPEGMAGKILSPSGGIVVHFDRFLLPSIAQVEYRLGEENHFLVTSIATPVREFLTRMYAVILFRTRFPGWLVKPILTPVALKIFRQDAAILRRQTEAIRRFGGEHYVSTEIDVLGLQIARLLRQAESGSLDANEDWSRELELEA